ncbi:MAG: zinc-dependent metalloprotease [Myxococcota bacterium]
MKHRSTVRVSLTLGLLGAAFAIEGCAQEREPINRVQANAMAKSFFVGAAINDPADDPEFLWRSYVVDGSMSQTLVTVGTGSEVDRIRWEVTEEMLIGRKSYQLVRGADDRGLPERYPDGTIVAAYPIVSHFDIRREYNPSTGEELNVLVENTSDRPWYEREYFRVDWSENRVENPLFLRTFLGRMFGELEVTSVVISNTDPSDHNRPHFEPEEGYFDVTSKFTVAPAQSGFIPGLPTCVVAGLFTGSSTYDCNDQEAYVRSSFLRIDEAPDFEPLEMSRATGDVVGNPAQINGSLLAGYSNTVEQGWDPGYGFTDALYKRFAHVHNTWAAVHQDHACASNEDLDGDGTADQCQNAVTGYSGAAGAQCDVHTEACTIPYRDRQIRPIAYHVNEAMPDDLQDPVDDAGAPTALGPSEEVMAGWDQLMRNAVAYAREVECRRTGGDRDACHAEFFEAEKEMLVYGGWLVDVPRDPTPVLTLCHNPVRGYDHEVCGPEGMKARLGDIRRNIMGYWPHASRAPYGGIGNWGADPLTGQIFGAAAMTMGRSATMAAAFQRDVIMVALGEMSIEDITAGVPAQNYVRDLMAGEEPTPLTMADIEARTHAVDAEHARLHVGPVPAGAGTMSQAVADMVAREQQTTADPAWLQAGQQAFEAVAAPLRDSHHEAQLVDQLWMTSAAGFDPALNPDGSALDAASPLRGMDPGAMRLGAQRIHQMMHAQGLCFGHDEAPIGGSAQLAGMARYFDAKYPAEEYDTIDRGKLIYRDLWIESYKGIAAHEVGHSLGLLHNFASSWDAANYHPGYWQLRTQEGASVASCEGQPRAPGEDDTCMGPRYLDPETEDERGLGPEARPAISYYGSTSVMEYALERFGETVGLGQYDAHAMKALYGRVLETYEEAERGGLTPEEAEAHAPRLSSQLGSDTRVTREDGPFAGQEFPKPTHYTELARILRLYDAQRCRDATDEERARAGWRLVHGKVCAPPPRDHAAWADFQQAGPVFSGWSDSVAPFVRTRDGVGTGAGKVRWAYRYGATFNSYFHTQAGDAGADEYEVTKNAVDAFEGRYPWTYFRRQNREYVYTGLPMRASGAHFEQLRAYHWQAANRNAFYRSFGEPTWDVIRSSDDWHRPLLMAETEMFNALARYILMPQPGAYAPQFGFQVDASRPICDVAGNGQMPQFSVDAVDGRFIDQQFNSDPDGGGSWNYLQWMIHAGFGAEKTLAAMALADGRAVLSTISRENYLDGRNVNINFRSDMPLAVDRLLGGILAEDWESVAPFTMDRGEAARVELTPLHLTDEMPARPASASLLFPNVGYKQQLGALIFSHVYSRMGGDLTLANKLRVWIDGQLGEVDVPEAQQVRFYDPTSGYTYVARRYGDDVIDGRTVDRGIASRMVAHANELAAAAYAVEEVDGELVFDAFGRPVLSLDDAGHPLVVDADREAELRRYVGLMDAARQIAAVVGYGPL